MPRRQRQQPSPEDAVSTSPLFDLPLEIRLMIYKLLLVQDYGVAIAHDAFKRIKPRRDSNRPCIHTDSGIFFTNNAHSGILKMAIPPCIHLPDLPHVNTAILRTCRLVHDEATPILYKCNSFCFSDLTTADNFRWIASKYASSIQEIRFNCAITCQKPHAWKDLSENFPQLKRMRLRVSTPMDRRSCNDILKQLEELARHFRGLDWVQIQGSFLWDRLEVLNPMIERDSETGLMHVLKHVAIPVPTCKPIPADPTFAELLAASNFIYRDTDSTSRWTTLWWGRDGEQPPESSRHMR